MKDPTICLVGFQASIKETEPGLYLFNHIPVENPCGTTISVDVETFFSMYEGPMFKDIKCKSPECEGRCTRVEDLSRCPVECKNAVARKIMQDFSKCKSP